MPTWSRTSESDVCSRPVHPGRHNRYNSQNRFDWTVGAESGSQGTREWPAGQRPRLLGADLLDTAHRK